MNNNGQALVLFVVLIPILFILFAFVFDTSIMIRESGRVDSIARDSVKYLMDGKTTLEVSKVITKNDKDIKIINITDNGVHLKKEIDSIFGKIIGFDTYKIEVNLFGKMVGDKLIINEKGK